MERCPDENEIAQYADYLCLGSETPPRLILNHMAECYECKVEILELCVIMDMLLAGDVQSN